MDKQYHGNKPDAESVLPRTDHRTGVAESLPLAIVLFANCTSEKEQWRTIENLRTRGSQSDAGRDFRMGKLFADVADLLEDSMA
jgi:hypothetical protein